MLKEYIKKPSVKEANNSVDSTMLNSLINYSKSIEVKKINNQKILINLN